MCWVSSLISGILLFSWATFAISMADWRVVLDRRLLGRQFHVGRAYPGRARESLLDSARTGGARHPRDGERGLRPPLAHPRCSGSLHLIPRHLIIPPYPIQTLLRGACSVDHGPARCLGATGAVYSPFVGRIRRWTYIREGVARALRLHHPQRRPPHRRRA